MNKDNLFRIIVYSISIYLIFQNNSISINICGWTILISHIFKDITNLDKWPRWCEYVGIILSILLINGGIQISNYFIVFLGLSKFLAHMRQIIYNNNRYYY
tara:strand:+ start:659 stop:961 length:303 start_codon:yes stop_codon:yes gene_type:complete